MEFQIGTPFLNVNHNVVWDICHYARHRKLKFPISTHKASKCYEMFHFDIWGPLSMAYIHGHKYFLTTLDDYNIFTWVILCKSKTEIFDLVQKFLIIIENQYHNHVKIVRSDNDPEFLMPNFYASKGIEHQTRCVETPQ